MIEVRYDLKLANGKVVSWVGATPEEAARRYVDCVRPGVAVVATRRSDNLSVTVLGRGGRIIG